MFQITDEMILSRINNQSLYQKGILYFFSDRISNFIWDNYSNTINATVSGTKKYDIDIKFSDRGQIINTYCTCKPSESYPNGCKHVAAVLKYAQAQSRKIVRAQVREDQYALNIFKYFQNSSEGLIKKEITLKAIYEYDYDTSTISHSHLSFKIGIDKLYVVKSIKDLINAINTESTIEYGKAFTFNPSLHKFSQNNEKIINVLNELVEIENTINFSNYGRASLFSGKKVYMSSSLLNKFFEILKFEPITAIINHTLYNHVTIVYENIPIQFKVEDSDNNDFYIKIASNTKFIPLSGDASCFFYNENIYKIDRAQQKSLEPFLNVFQHNMNAIRFKASQKEKFVSEVLPIMQNSLDISLSENMEGTIIKEDLCSEVYLDMMDGILTSRVKFKYGNFEINPFNPSENIKEKDKILMRNMPKENSVMAIFENSNFLVNKDYLYIDSDDKIYEFIYETLPQLQGTTDIYYSDAFNSLKITENKKFSIGVRLNMSSSTLEMTIDYGDIDPSELKDVFNSFYIKKKYHKLKSGAFVPLDNDAFEKMSDILEYMDLSEKDLKAKTISLPMNKAMYLNSNLGENTDLNFNKSDEFNTLVNNILEPITMDFEPPQSLASLLRPYQITGFKWLKTLAYYGLGGILADDMGLGKTLQTIAFILSEREKHLGPCIVVCPTSLVYNWLDEINKFAPELKSLAIYGDQNLRQELLKDIENIDLIITSYPLIRRDIELYQNTNFAYCFLDEAQNIKNPDSINSKSVKEIKARGYFVLTGTPIENSLTEMWSLFDFIMPGYLLSHSKFVKKYEKPIIKDKDKKALQELSKQIRPFIMRRMKKEVLTELPEKIESKIMAELTPEQNKIYLAYMHHIQTDLAAEIAANGYEKSQMKVLAALTRLRQICCHPNMFIENYKGDSGKLIVLLEILDEAIQNGHRILIFSQFTSMLRIISPKLKSLNIDYFYLDGKTKAETRSEYVKRFNEGEKEVFLISLKAGGTGLNLTGADMVIHFDPWWNPAVEDQATDRAYRIGQNNSVQVMKLITKGTIEEKIYELQERKRELINSVIEPGETFINKMNESDIKDLFEI